MGFIWVIKKLQIQIFLGYLFGSINYILNIFYNTLQDSFEIFKSRIRFSDFNSVQFFYSDIMPRPNYNNAKDVFTSKNYLLPNFGNHK